MPSSSKRSVSAWHDKLENHVRDHLNKVYGTLALTMLYAILGIIVNALIDLSSYVHIIAMLECPPFIALLYTKTSKKNLNKRLAFMSAFFFLVGCEIGPLIEYVGFDPNIVFNAIFVTMLVFGSLAMSAFFTDSTKYLHLGGLLSSALFCMLIINFVPYMPFLRPFTLWAGLAINSAFVLYDTQRIVARCRHDYNDCIWHTVMLFQDIAYIFRNALILLKDKKDAENKRRR
ncbi:hypothetical protein niasHS_001947 [Heterodera schachtii]|uniref:Bax inhibitor n=2 Tax=Heterodera TaxID=34509 RepID=A0ABD2KAX2_HETSC